ncbi:thioredoxin-disulfide reductase [uncultured Desulfovibrio sp.]|uniref:thioredoxin-disulfide reductase n=1 Tax=uncultured Desulfovibrio sp. TaxID=167968 RepID=UPI002612D737|nr:thioredoxin-disulfide reductase [uncultured Desulfovibrio sp.]
MEQRELVIIGAGPAGLTAAIYGKRAGLDVLVLEKGKPGGQILITSEIENWPGTISASGAGLADSFRAHAEYFKAEFRTAAVAELRPAGGKTVVVTDQGEIEAKALIIATGANFRKQGCAGEKEFTGKGVSYCAVCDAAFFEDLEVAVIGGGNTAVEEACYLTQFAEKVYIVHRRDQFRADKLVAERAMKNPRIVPIWDSVLEAIEGDGLVERMVLKNVKTGEKDVVAVNGVFIFIGTLPNAVFIGDAVKTTENGWIITDENMKTSTPGIFAAGDVRDTALRQVVTAAGDGARAAMSAYAYIMENK